MALLRRKRQERKVVTIRSIEGRARDLPGIRKPSRQEYDEAAKKFLEACQKSS